MKDTILKFTTTCLQIWVLDTILVTTYKAI